MYQVHIVWDISIFVSLVTEDSHNKKSEKVKRQKEVKFSFQQKKKKKKTAAHWTEMDSAAFLKALTQDHSKR